MSGFKRGDKVVWVMGDVDPDRLRFHPNGTPEYGRVYTIRDVYYDQWQSVVDPTFDGLGCFVEEIVSVEAMTMWGRREIGFKQSCFRLLIEDHEEGREDARKEKELELA